MTPSRTRSLLCRAFAAMLALLPGVANGQAAPPELVPTAPPAPRAPAEFTLNVGDPAPPIDVRGFLAGGPVAAHGEGKIRVLLFWSTVCWPCRAAMPDVAVAAAKHSDSVSMIGLFTDQLEAVDEFVELTPWGPYLTYPIAIDRSNSSQQRYLDASGRRVLPMAFIIGRDGVIEWFGSPREMDGPLDSIVAGTWDRADGVAATERRRDFERLQRRRAVALVQATNAEDWDRVLELIAELEAADPTATGAPTERFRVLLVRAGRIDEGHAAAADLLRRFPRDAAILHRTARLILEQEDRATRDTELAYRIALRACEQTLHEHPGKLATLAAAHEANGRLAEAIDTLVAAIDRVGSVQARRGMNETLAEWRHRLATGATEADAGNRAVVDAPDGHAEGDARSDD